MQEPEALYGVISKEIIARNCASVAQLEYLRFFWLLMRNRGNLTSASIHSAVRDMRGRAFDDSPAEREFLGKEEPPEFFVKMALQQTARHLEHIADLGVALLTSCGRIPFLTSDNPAVDANRFVLHWKGRLQNWGFASAGIYLYMPISRDMAFFAYDRGVYNIGKGGGGVITLRDDDVHLLNCLVLMNCDESVYFSRKADEAYIRENLFDLVADSPVERFRVNLAVRDEASDGLEQNFVVTDDEDFRQRGGIIHLESIKANPVKHISLLRYRTNRRFFDTKSGAGVLRPKSKGYEEFVSRS